MAEFKHISTQDVVMGKKKTNTITDVVLQVQQKRSAQPAVTFLI